MNRDTDEQIKRILGGADHLSPSYAMLNALLYEAHKVKREAEAKLTPAERAERKRQAELKEIWRLRKSFVVSGRCPDCEDGKLIRGKKSKAHGYQRLWKCASCGHDYTWEGKRV